MNSPSPIPPAAHRSKDRRSGSGGLAVVLTLGLALAASQVAAQVTAPGGCPTITIAPPTLPDGLVGTFYDQTLTASGGAAPYTFTVAPGTLPPGLTLTLGGRISGTPTASGTYGFTVFVSDSVECPGSQFYTIVVCPTITLAPSSLPGGTVGTPYSQTITASGGTAPYTFTFTGTLPPGLTLTSSGVISGTPTTGGSFTFTVTATESTGGTRPNGGASACSGTQTYTIVVCPAITLAPSSLPGGSIGTPYSQTITASGGTAPYNFTFTGTLPPGLMLTSSGVIAGTPTTGGSFTFTVTAAESTGGTRPNGSVACTGTQTYTIVIGCPPITLAPSSLPGGLIGTPYNQTITASGGTAPYTFTSTGTLPPGLTLSPGGVIARTPTTEGSFTFTVTATDSTGGTRPSGSAACTGTQTYTIVIGCPTITLAPSALPDGSVGEPYSRTITASGGNAPYDFTHTGTLPPGLTLSAGGVISGTPTSGGTFSFSVTATDSTGCRKTRSYTIVVTCAVISLTPATLPGGSVGTLYGPVIIGASGGASPYTFTVTSGSLPPGLTLLPNDAASVQIAGTPTAFGDYSFTISVSDGVGCTGSGTYFVSICDPPGAPQNPTIVPTGNPDGVVTGVDFLDLSWSPPSAGAPPTSYDWQINGNALVNTTSTFVHGVTPQALVVPTYNNDPIQLHVFARACGIPGVQGPRADSPIYTPAPPTAAFDATVAGLTVTVTDRSSPQATSWLWLFGDGSFSTEQAPGPHTYAASNLYTIVLIASNGAGSNQAATPVQLASLAPVAQRTTVLAFDAPSPTQLRLEAVPLTGRGEKWLYVDATEQDEEKVVYLRFLDEDGNPVVERRLALAPGQTQAVYNLEAFRLNGSYTVELVSYHSLSAYLVAPTLSLVDPRPRPRRVDR